MTFQPGQILNGKIIKLFPNGIASLQVGSQKVVAQLGSFTGCKHAILVSSSARRWKGKTKGNGNWVPESRLSQDGIPITGLMNELSISTKDVNEEIIRFF